MKRSLAWSAMLIGALAIGPPVTAEEPPGNVDLRSLSLEELMHVEITSVSKKSERLFDASAAVFVITNEDIERYGATTIPEALRLAPGLEVARIDGNKWAVTSRGFNGQYANKLLVLIDGRTVYTPLFSGIFWEIQDVFLEDVDRIEVIRGPGATLWGANAVNGIINIITKSSADTPGNLLLAGSGTFESGLAGFRHGGTLGDAGHYRAFVKYHRRDELDLPTGGSGDDASETLRVGFRADWNATEQDELTVQGDYYDGEIGQTYTLIDSFVPPFTSSFGFDAEVSGANVLARWTHNHSDTTNRTLQVYYDRTDRDDAFASETGSTFDVELQGRRTLGKHSLVTGLGYRRTTSDIQGSFTFSADPPRRSDDLFNLFLHDDVMLRPDHLRLTLGAKLEHNDYTGLEFQPNVRLLWTPNDRHSFWAAASRAVRTPSRGETETRLLLDALPPDTVFPGAPSALIAFTGSPDVDSEDLLALEVGCRFVWRDELSLDFTTFYNRYDSLINLEPGVPFLEPQPVPLYLVLPMLPDNKSSGHTFGAELVLDWQPLPRWRIRTNLTTLHLHLKLDADSMAVTSPDQGTEGWSPDYQWSVRSSVDLPHDLDFDLFLRHVDELPTLGVERYTALDGRLAWQASSTVQIELVGRNLTDNDSVEFVTSFINAASTVTGRSVHATVFWSF